MFGYITIKKEELKIKDYQTYQAYYCGLCQELRERFGRTAQATLTYDMTFLAILLTGLYEDTTKKEEHRCLLHPAKKHLCLRNEFTEYAADMNVILCYYNLLDDWQDEKKAGGLLGARLLRKSFLQAAKKYPRQVRAVKSYLKKLHSCEEQKLQNVELAAGYTGELMQELFVCREDIWSADLRKLGFYMGKFIYLMDAYDDVEKDAKSGNYNPFLQMYEQEDFDAQAEQILTMMAASAAQAFEKLPILENVDILRNILYVGIWWKFDTIRKKNREKK